MFDGEYKKIYVNVGSELVDNREQEEYDFDVE